MGMAAYQDILKTHRHAMLPSYHPYSQLVHKVAKRIIQAAGLSHLDWEVHVINHPQQNAFVLPGGKIFVFTGLFPITETEDGMAAVIGHEMAHQIARHAGEKLSFIKILMGFQFLMHLFFDPGPLLRRLIVEYGLFMPFSRQCESEADYIGLMLISQACYEPRAAIGVWERMRQGRINEYMSTHPSNTSRIENIRKWLPEAERKRQESDCLQAAQFMGLFRQF